MRFHLNVVRGRSAPRMLAIDAPTAEEACRQAIGQGFTVLSDTPARLGWPRWLGSRTKGARLDVAVFVEQLRDLFVAGLSVIESLDALRRGAQGASVTVIERLQRQLHEGKTLSDALAADPVFPPLLVALVRASELTSDLPATLTSFLEHEQRTTEVRHKIVSTAIYPLLLMGVGALVLLFLLFYVMPRFARVFESLSSGHLPWSAQAMVAWSRMLNDHRAWWWMALGMLAAAVLGAAASPSLRAGLFGRVLAWAPFHQRIRIYFLARWYRATGLLVKGGIPLPEALRLSNGLLPPTLQASGHAVERAVREGLSPSAAHLAAGMATPVAEQLMLAGERTGDLGTILSRIAQFHETEVSRTLERTMRTLEPVVMVFIGLCVGVVVVLMYLPIFELSAAIQ